MQIQFSKSGIPCMWTGMDLSVVTIVVNKDGSKPQAIFIDWRHGKSLCVLDVGSYVLSATRSGMIIHQIISYDMDYQICHRFDGKSWDIEPPEFLRGPINLVLSCARAHCPAVFFNV